MKSIYAVMVALVGVLILGISAEANPGRSASHCVDFRSGNNGVIVSNRCGQNVFIIYCGDLRYSNKDCGDGPNGGYYTHSRNIDGGDTYTIDVDGGISYGSCLGRIGFGNDKFSDESNGNFNCLQ